MLVRYKILKQYMIDLALANGIKRELVLACESIPDYTNKDEDHKLYMLIYEKNIELTDQQEKILKRYIKLQKKRQHFIEMEVQEKLPLESPSMITWMTEYVLEEEPFAVFYKRHILKQKAKFVNCDTRVKDIIKAISFQRENTIEKNCAFEIMTHQYNIMKRNEEFIRNSLVPVIYNPFPLFKNSGFELPDENLEKFNEEKLSVMPSCLSKVWGKMNFAIRKMFKNK